MSRLTVSRITLAGLLTVVFTTTTHSQESPAIAPMPRAKHQNRLEIELRFGSPNGLELKWQAEPAARLPLAPPCEKCEQPRLLFVPATPVSPFTPACPTAPPTTVRPVAGHVPTDSMKQMANDAFNQLLQQSGVTQTADTRLVPLTRVTPIPPPVATPLPVHAPILLTTPAPAPMTAKPTHIGKWYREVGSVLYTIDIQSEHIVVTMTIIAVENGKTLKQELLVTGDYHMSRDGNTLVGLITGLDATLEGNALDDITKLQDATRMSEEIGKIRKAIVDQPFAVGVRVYGDSLMVGTVKGPILPNSESNLPELFGGRYKNANGKPVPTPKPMTAKNERVPAPEATVGAPPTPELIPATALTPVPTAPTVPTMTPPAMPVPQMTPPVAPNTN